MFPEDSVLVGVIKTQRDLAFARDAHWYRIPQARMPQGIYASYLAFFLSGAVFRERSGSIACYAARHGLELAYRRDLVPAQPDHPRANDVYYRCQLGELREKTPPILNPTRRRFAFIHTTWDRFCRAATIPDLYSTADYFVDRIYHALRSEGIHARHVWEVEARATGRLPGLRILCQQGELLATPTPDAAPGTEPGTGLLLLDTAQGEDAVLAALRAEIARQGGPVTINIPFDD